MLLLLTQTATAANQYWYHNFMHWNKSYSLGKVVTKALDYATAQFNWNYLSQQANKCQFAFEFCVIK